MKNIFRGSLYIFLTLLNLIVSLEAALVAFDEEVSLLRNTDRISQTQPKTLELQKYSKAYNGPLIYAPSSSVEIFKSAAQLHTSPKSDKSFTRDWRSIHMNDLLNPRITQPIKSKKGSLLLYLFRKKPKTQYEVKKTLVLSDKGSTDTSSLFNKESLALSYPRKEKKSGNYLEGLEIEVPTLSDEALVDLRDWKRSTSVLYFIEQIELRTNKVVDLLKRPDLNIEDVEGLSNFLKDLNVDENGDLKNLREGETIYLMIQDVWKASKSNFPAEVKTQIFYRYEYRLKKIFDKLSEQRFFIKKGKKETLIKESMEIVLYRLKKFKEKLEDEIIMLDNWRDESMKIIEKFNSLWWMISDDSNLRVKQEKNLDKILTVSAVRSGNEKLFKEFYKISVKVRGDSEENEGLLQSLISEISPLKKKDPKKRAIFYYQTHSISEELYHATIAQAKNVGTKILREIKFYLNTYKPL
ncbi:expressed protein [Phakopsora pachyrhizi]|uniref:Expressed protein n=1 Tax=Phakopsora pachyrhizi TaxID=170000 RepID=A0AAV0AL60_PHAPC|nr:expressed protein [Phakopsora pachyrhizi]